MPTQSMVWAAERNTWLISTREDSSSQVTAPSVMLSTGHVITQFLKQHMGQFTSPVTVVTGVEFPVDIWNFTLTTAATTPSGECQRISNTAVQSVKQDFVDVSRSTVDKTMGSSDDPSEAFANDDEENELFYLFNILCLFL